MARVAEEPACRIDLGYGIRSWILSTYDGMQPGEARGWLSSAAIAPSTFPAEATRNIRIAGGGVPPRALRIPADLRRGNDPEAGWRGAIVVDAGWPQRLGHPTL